MQFFELFFVQKSWLLWSEFFLSFFVAFLDVFDTFTAYFKNFFQNFVQNLNGPCDERFLCGFGPDLEQSTVDLIN
jgi:hypothetical protein